MIRVIPSFPACPASPSLPSTPSAPLAIVMSAERPSFPLMPILPSTPSLPGAPSAPGVPFLPMVISSFKERSYVVCPSTVFFVIFRLPSALFSFPSTVTFVALALVATVLPNSQRLSVVVVSPSFFVRVISPALMLVMLSPSLNSALERPLRFFASCTAKPPSWVPNTPMLPVVTKFASLIPPVISSWVFSLRFTTVSLSPLNFSPSSRVATWCSFPFSSL